MKKVHKTILEEYAKGDDIMATVAQDVLDKASDYDGDVFGYLNDLQRGGCARGMVSGLIYYTDTHEFYAKHAGEIDGILEDLEANTGEGFKFDGRDVRNTLAWLAYEETAYKLYGELENA